MPAFAVKLVGLILCNLDECKLELNNECIFSNAVMLLQLLNSILFESLHVGLFDAYITEVKFNYPSIAIL